MQLERWNTIRSLRESGNSIKMISRLTGHDRKTVRRYLEMEEPPKTETKPSILDPFKEFIEEQLSKGFDNCVVIREQIQKKGYKGSLTTIQRYVQPKRPINLSTMPAPQVETDPAEEFQVDWGDFNWINSEGVKGKLYCFVMILSWSRMRYIEFTLDMTSETLIKCHLNAFDYLGGVPKKGLFDNMKTVVTTPGKEGERKLHAPFEDFANTQGFKVDLCPVRWPRRKGKVERGVSYVRGNLWPQIDHVCSLEELNRRARDWCETVNAKVHGSTQEKPMTRWLEVEKELLAKVRPFTPYSLVDRKVSRTCLITYNTNKYAVPHEHAGKIAKVKVQNDDLKVLINGEVVDSHRLCKDRNQLIDEKGNQITLQRLVSSRLRKRRRQTRMEYPPLLFHDEEEIPKRDLSEYDEEVSE